MKKISIISVLLFFALNSFAQFDGPRVYWALPKNLNILSGHAIMARGNASVNNISFINPNVTVNNNLYLLTYTRSQPLFGRTFYSTLAVSAGDLSAMINADPQGPASVSSTLFVHGLGDLVWSNTINVFGAPGLMIKDFVRHENPTLVYLQTALTFPTGQYNSENPVNIGSNQFKFKLGIPLVQRLSPRVDGRQLTLELLPAFTFITKNNDFQGQEVKQSGLFSLETHLTRDVTRKAFISIDYSYINGGSADFVSKATGMVLKEQAGQNAHLFGGTLSFKINDYLNIFITHNQTVASGNDDLSLQGSVTKFTLSWSFHDFQEQFRGYMESN